MLQGLGAIIGSMPGTPTTPWIQFKIYNSNPDATTHTITPNSTPTTGHLLTLILNAGSTIPSISGWTKNSTLVNDVETSIYSKISAGTESSIAVTASGSCTMQMVFFEWPTWTTFDQQVTDTGAIGGGTMAFGTTSTTTAASEIAIACGGSDLATPQGDPQPTTAWGSGFTEVSNAGATNGAGPPYAIMLGVSVKVLSATGTVTTTWTFHNPGSTVGIFNTLIATYK